MKKSMLAIALIGVVAATPVFADLANPYYVAGRKAYVGGDCRSAVPLLKMYSSQDADFLSKNPAVQSQLQAAINACKVVMAAAAKSTINMVAGGSGPPGSITADVHVQSPDWLQQNLAPPLNADGAIKKNAGNDAILFDGKRVLVKPEARPD